MTNEEIIEKIRTTLAEEFEIDVELIQPDAPLMQTLELDSLDLVDMVVLIDRNFGFTVTAKDFAMKGRECLYNKVKCCIAGGPCCFCKKLQYISIHFKSAPRATAMYIVPILS